MKDFSDILTQAKKMQERVKETQEIIKKIEAEGVSGGGSVRVYLDGNGELKKLFIEEKIYDENKEIIEDLIVAAHADAKEKVKKKTSDELSKFTGGLNLPPDFKFPL